MLVAFGSGIEGRALSEVEGQERAGVSLAPPAELRAEPGDTIASLTWSPVEGAEGYRVFISTSEQSTPTLIGSVPIGEFLALGLDNGRTYQFRVAAYSGDLQGALSKPIAVSPVSAAVERPAPAPAGPQAIGSSGHQVIGSSGQPTSARATVGKQANGPTGQQLAEVQPTPTPIAMPPAAPSAAPAVESVPVPEVMAGEVAAPAPLVSAAPEVAAPEVVAPEVVAPPAAVASEGVEIAPVDGPPAAAVPASRPTLTAKAGNRTVTLTWTAVPDATSYRIFRTTTGTFSTTPLATTTTATTYANTSLTNGTTYIYTVAARNSSGDGPQADAVAATPIPPPATPAGVMATAGNRQVNLSWVAVTGATSYRVYRGTVTNTQTLLTNGVTSTTQFVDSTVENGPTYFYKVTAVNDGGESARSLEVNASPTGPPAGIDAATLAAYRLLRRATWGPRAGDVAAVKKIGAEAFIDYQLALGGSAYPDTLLTQSSNNVQVHFARLALTADDQLRQRVAFALHKIWVVSGVEIASSAGLVNYHRALLTHAFGNYRDVMEAVTLTPAMGRYLNMLNNRSEQLTGAPANENYARELMQLFTLGIPTLRPDGVPFREDGAEEIPAYSEIDVKELARILTGWTFGDGNPATVPAAAGAENYNVPMEPVAAFHDNRSKVFLGVTFPAGQSTRTDLGQALDLLFQHPNLGPFVSRQLIQQLVTSNPSPGYVWAVSRVFEDNGNGVRGDLAAVVKAILLHPLATEDAPDPGKLAEPVLFAVSMLRALNAVVTDPRFVVDQAANMGQRALFPPSVFSYFSPGFRVRGAIGREGPLSGPEFQSLTTVTAQTRVNFVASLLAGSFGSAVSVDYTPFTSRAADPAVLVDYCSEVLMGTRMPLDIRTEIITAVRVTAATNPLERARTAIYLTLTAAAQQVD